MFTKLHHNLFAVSLLTLLLPGGRAGSSGGILSGSLPSRCRPIRWATRMPEETQVSTRPCWPEEEESWMYCWSMMIVLLNRRPSAVFFRLAISICRSTGGNAGIERRNKPRTGSSSPSEFHPTRPTATPSAPHRATHSEGPSSLPRPSLERGSYPSLREGGTKNHRGRGQGPATLRREISGT
jgi:hypothetical protein